MNIYTILSKAYDLLDVIYFSEKDSDPREVIKGMITNEKSRVLDMCCGTLSNSIELAKDKPNIKVLGVDISESMLKIAKKKIRKQRLTNAHLRCVDATDTMLPDNKFDYVIIGLVLHESSPRHAANILKEARRVLKPDGKLIIMEWEMQLELKKKVMFGPIYWMERLNCRSFNKFYTMDKADYFKKQGFEVNKQCHCNYSVVLELSKSNIS